jgi:MFS family permease
MNESEPPDNLAAPAKIAGDSPYALFRNRDFSLYLIGRFIAVFGQQMLSVAVDWDIYARTHSALPLAFVGASQMVSIVLCTLPAGYIADNFNRKRVILLTTFLVALGASSLALVSAHTAPLAWIYVCLIIVGAAKTILWPANASFLPHLVTRQQLPRAIAFNAGAFQLAVMLGLAAGGEFVAHGGAPWIVYGITALTSLSYFIMTSFIRREHHVATRQPFSLEILSAGVHFIFQNKIILGVITLDLFAVLLGGAASLYPIFARDVLQTPSAYGFLNAVMPIGAVLCTLYVAHHPPLQKAGRTMLLSVAVFGLATIAFGVGNQNCFGPAIPNHVWLWFAALMMLVRGAVDNVSVVVRQTLVQLLTPDEKRGRVSAINSLFIGTSNELGGFVSAFFAWLFGQATGHSQATGAIMSTSLGGLGTVLVVLAVAWIWPEVRRYGKLA